MPLTKKEEEMFEGSTPMDFCIDGKYSDKELIDCLSSVLKASYERHRKVCAEIAHFRERKLIEKTIEILEESKNQINGGGNGRRILTQAIIKIKIIK